MNLFNTLKYYGRGLILPVSEIKKWETLTLRIGSTYNIVIIKDIGATHKFGNFCNRIHDRIINGEKINNVYPDTIEDWLKTSGYSISRKFIPKLWYPHFIIVGVRNND